MMADCSYNKTSEYLSLTDEYYDLMRKMCSEIKGNAHHRDFEATKARINEIIREQNRLKHN